MDIPAPPKHLSNSAKAFWVQTTRFFSFEPDALRLLQLACEAWDRGQQARETLDREGMTYQDRFNAPRLRPEAIIERDSRLAFARLLKQLELADEPPSVY